MNIKKQMTSYMFKISCLKSIDFLYNLFGLFNPAGCPFDTTPEMLP